MHLRHAIPVLSLALLSACDPEPATSDAFVVQDAGAADTSILVLDDARDAFVLPDDASVDAFAIDTMSDAPSTPGTSVSMTYATQTGTFDRAFMGYVRTGGAITGLYFEFSRGADDVCPSATSPTPQQVITIDGFSHGMPAAQTTGIMARFFDFEGLFRTEIAPDAPTMSRVEVTAIDTTAGTAEGNVSFTFERGSATGSFCATHCDSLDAM